MGGAGKLNIEYVKNKIKELNENIEILSDEYINNDTKLQCRCLICGNEWESRWRNLQSKKGCPDCRSLKLSIDEVKYRMVSINNNIRICGEDYSSGKRKFKCECFIDGKVWSASWSNLQKGSGCPKCKSKKLRELRTIDEDFAIKIYSTINNNIAIFNSFNHCGMTWFNCNCRICNHNWTSRWSNLYKGRGCPKCALINISGENSYRWNPELTEDDRLLTRGLPRYIAWRKAVFDRELYTCEICNTNGYVNAHHKDGYHWCIERRFDLTNGACVCEDCHRLFHKIYGNKHNTEQQWLEFYESHKLKI